MSAALSTPLFSPPTFSSSPQLLPPSLSPSRSLSSLEFSSFFQAALSEHFCSASVKTWCACVCALTLCVCPLSRVSCVCTELCVFLSGAEVQPFISGADCRQGNTPISLRCFLTYTPAAYWTF